jgi:class 3 adenylate cyclase
LNCSARLPWAEDCPLGFDAEVLVRHRRVVIDAARDLGLELRVGIHTGECEVRGDDLGGLAVHIAARVAACSLPGEAAVTATVEDLVAGSGIDFDGRGEHEMKGVPGLRHLFAAR